jgi:hypothetical protein
MHNVSITSAVLCNYSPRMRALALAVLVVAVSGCRCGGKTTGATSDLRVTPGALQFGDVAIGASLPLTFEIDNGGQASGDVMLTVEGPFTLSATTATVGAGSAAMFTVTFAPSVKGPVTGTVHVVGVADVALSGDGLPACVPSQACVRTAFALETRTCVETPLPEGTVCMASCLSGAGSCRQGYCVGTPTSCIDGDACTLDVCLTDGGCLNPPLTCPVTDPCQAQFCDPQTGCGSTPLDDGTPCGSATCEEAHVCFSGTCQDRMRPNAMTDCRYTALAAGSNHTCVVTRGGGLRCWGANNSDQQDRGFPSQLTAPGFAVDFPSVRATAISEAHDTWVSLPAGQLATTTAPTLLPIDATLIAVGLNNTVCGIEAGDVRCAAGADGGGPPTTAAHDALAISMSADQLCVVHTDGGVACGTPASLAPIPIPAAATSVATSIEGSACALLKSGAVHCWGDIGDAGTSRPWSSGVTALAAERRRLFFVGAPIVCAALDAGRIECIEPGGNQEQSATSGALPPSSAIALGDFHGCALLNDGRVMCWGTNSDGQLGDRSTQPLGVQSSGVRASWLSAFSQVVLFANAGGPVLAMDQLNLQGDDAGMLLGQPSTTVHSGSQSSFAAGCPCGFDAGNNCGSNTLGELTVDGAVACALTGSDHLCVARSGGDVRCYYPSINGGDGGVARQLNAGGEITALAAEIAGDGVCALLSNGTVHCDHALPGNTVAESLTQVKQLCLGEGTQAQGCALLANGQLQCWGAWTGSATPAVPSGAWPLSRQVACGNRHVCALAGINIVKCWGDNQSGQLGRDGPASTAAADIPMPAPVTAIAAGFAYTCALLQTGEVRCWGDNAFGELGTPLLDASRFPRLVDQ